MALPLRSVQRSELATDPKCGRPIARAHEAFTSNLWDGTPCDRALQAGTT